jgi:uroporphyrinogen-III synthase
MPLRPGALAFTSRNGVAALARRPELAGWRGLPAFTVGEATADAALGAGFTRVLSADGNVTALAQLISERRSEFQGEVLHLGARKPAGDLAGAVRSLRSIAVYETVTLELADAVKAGWSELGAVLFHSPRAARAFAAFNGSLDASNLLAVCISEAAAAPLRGRVRSVRVAEHPGEEALLDRLGKPARPG